MSNNDKYIPFKGYEPREETREAYEARRADWKQKQVKALREDIKQSEDYNNVERKVDRQNKVLASFWGWLKPSETRQDESSPATQAEQNGIKAVSGSSQNNNVDQIRKGWHLGDDGIMKNGDKEIDTGEDKEILPGEWYCDKDGFMKRR